MKIIRIILCLFIVAFFCGAASAQKSFVKDADNSYSEAKFFEAIELYKKAYSKEKNKAVKAEILFQLGECYFNTVDPKQAEKWYQKAIKAKFPDPIAVLRLAEVYKAMGNYPQAIVEFNNYKALNPSDKRGEDGVVSSEMAQKWIDEPTRYVVLPETQLNSKQYEFSPTYADKKNNTLIFTSTREGSAGKTIDVTLGESFSDIYETKRDKNGKWSTPAPIGGEVNSVANEGAACVDSKGRTMFFTRCGVEKNKDMPCKIYTAVKKGNAWTEITLLELSPDSITVGHPAITKDGNSLFFTASHMEGGFGGRDIWMSTYEKKAKVWTTPVNLGSSINTEKDEMFPFIHENGTLYFSSTGHMGMGGLDIFKAEKTGEKWGKVENLKYPINSAGDDYGIVFEGTKDRGFLTSNRDGSMGGDDIFSFVLPPLIFVLQGTITDVETKKPINQATIKLIGSDGTSAEVTTDASGTYIFGDKGNDRYIKSNTTYELTVSAKDYLNAKGKETTVGVTESTTFIKDFALQTTKKKEIAFPEVLYDLAKFTLRPESHDSLDFLYQTLIDNPTIVIELNSHTDSRGGQKPNQILSENRAKSCVTYLVSKGIAADRMLAKGYGKDQLLISDAEIAKLKSNEEKEAAHQKNRRTRFKVIRSDYVPVGGFPEEKTTSETPKETKDEAVEEEIEEDEE
ncbi:MAG: OmpA family protein [Bacteroidetes bacterium]|nr:OmpA family protein [Bacteroidota bacterium]HET6245264.1 OmpA family protein [Bacteroidia bacterium]